MKMSFRRCYSFIKHKNILYFSVFGFTTLENDFKSVFLVIIMQLSGVSLTCASV